MDVIATWRKRFAYFIFGIFMTWPLCHLILVNSFRISSWRLFGWGMYATPNPSAYSKLVIKIPGENETFDKGSEKDFDYFIHFGSTKHLAAFIKEALANANKSGREAYAFLQRPRFNLFQRKAYLESDIYKFSNDEIQYLGKIRK